MKKKPRKKGQGRKPKYGEKSKHLSTRVPESMHEDLKDLVTAAIEARRDFHTKVSS